MTDTGSRARLDRGDIARVFEVSQVRLDKKGHIADVWWAEVNARTNLAVGVAVTAPVSEVVTALHAGHRVLSRIASMTGHAPDREFVVVEHPDGHETIKLAAEPGIGREIGDKTRSASSEKPS